MAANPVTRQPTEQVEATPSDSAVRSVRVVQLGARDAAAEPPWPDLPPHQTVHWERFMRFLGPLEAQIVAGRLNVEGVPTIVLSSPAVDFSNTAEILVPRLLMHRARWVLAWPPVSEEELAFLATGQIGGKDSNGPL